MIPLLRRKRSAIISSIIILLFVFSFSTGTIGFNSISSIPMNQVSLQPIDQPSNADLQTAGYPSYYPAFTGSGTGRAAQEGLWAKGTVGGDVLPKTFAIDLPGSGYWTGTRVDLSIYNLYEDQNMWVSNGDFASSFTSWTPYNDNGYHTGPDITIAADQNYLVDVGAHMNAAGFNFGVQSTTSAAPPQYTSTDTDNTGDCGGIAHWTNTTVNGGTPIQYPSGAYYRGWANDIVTTYPWGAGDSGGTNNRAGAVRFYVGDTEASSGNQYYTITFSRTYTYSFYDFPVSTASLKFSWRYYSTDFDKGGTCGGTYYDDGAPTGGQGFDLYYSVYTNTESLIDQPVAGASFTASGATNPGDSGWTETAAIDLKANNLFIQEIGGTTFQVQFKFEVRMDVDDGRTTETHSLTSDTCADHNNEDSDYIYMFIDGIELTATVPQTFGANVNPYILQNIAFNRRNATDGYLRFSYIFKNEFFCDKTADDYINLEVSANAKTQAYSLKTGLIHDNAWHTVTLGWTWLSGVLGTPGPATITLNFSITMKYAGWYPKPGSNYFYIDDVILRVKNFAPASMAQVQCIDLEHGVSLPWNVENSEHWSRLSASKIWQEVNTSSSLLIRTTSSATISYDTIYVTFYAQTKYPLITPFFNITTDADGRTDSVVWTMSYSSPPLTSSTGVIPSWNYSLTIPGIANWNPGVDWQLVSVKDGAGGSINYQEGATTPMKNLTLYDLAGGATPAAGTWVVTYQSPNRITSFNVVNKDGATTWVYYPGGANRSRIQFATGVRQSSSANISLYYLDGDRVPVMAQYFNRSIFQNTNYTGTGRTPYWNIPVSAKPSDEYVAMVKWIDNGTGYLDEIGFAAHYVQVIRNISVSGVGFLHSGIPSNYVLQGETLDISVGVTDPLLVTCQDFDSRNITFHFPLKSNPFQLGNSKDLVLAQELNNFVYHLDTDGSSEPNEWPVKDAFMGMSGNISFTIDLYKKSTYINGRYEYYQLIGWFHNIVDTKYSSTNLKNADDPGRGSAQDQGGYLKVDLTLLDDTYGHKDAKTNIIGSSLINNRSSGSPIPDVYPAFPQPRDGIADTWNGTVKIQWILFQTNLSNWCGGSGNPNLEAYKWNGTIIQEADEANLYSGLIKIPDEAFISAVVGTYYLRVNTTFMENEWGWKVENLSTALSFTVEEAKGFETGLEQVPDTPQYYWWKNSSREVTRLYVRYYIASSGQGFNSTLLAKVESWFVKSYAQGYFSGLSVTDFGRNWNPIYWNFCKAGTLLPDGITLDPHAEVTGTNNTYGWFYHDYNWTKVKLPIGTFDQLPTTQEIQIGITADIVNETEYQKKSGTFTIYIKPNEVQIEIVLKNINSKDSYLDPNYYGLENCEDTYYWGDILNFTIDARDTIENSTIAGVSLRYSLEKGAFKIGDWLNASSSMPGRYTAILNTSDPTKGLMGGITYKVYIKGLKENYSVTIYEDDLLLTKRATQLLPEMIAGVFYQDSVLDYNYLSDILAVDEPRSYAPLTDYFRTVANHMVYINVSLFDNSKRDKGSIFDANVKWILRHGPDELLRGWTNTSIAGIFCICVNLTEVTIDPSDIDDPFTVEIKPYKDNFDNELEFINWWEIHIRISHRPVVLIPITPISMSYSQSSWVNHPIQFVAMDPISRENISGCTINWQIEGTEFEGAYMDEYAPGHYQVSFNAWPSLFEWVGGGIYRLSAEIVLVPDPDYYCSSNGWKISDLHEDNRITLTVESEGFLGPLSMYFYIILGIIGAVLVAFYSYKSYKFLTTPFVIRKIEESIDKISKDKKIASGVMKSRDHLIFLEATELLHVVGAVLKPPPEKKLPPPIEKIMKPVEEKGEKIPEIPMEIVDAELDKAGVRPEEKPILIQQIKELATQDKREFIEGLIGEQRYQEIIEELKKKGTEAKKS